MSGDEFEVLDLMFGRELDHLIEGQVAQRPGLNSEFQLMFSAKHPRCNWEMDAGHSRNNEHTVGELHNLACIGVIGSDSNVSLRRVNGKTLRKWNFDYISY